MDVSLPFSRWECQRCGFFARSEDPSHDHNCEPTSDIPQTEDMAIARFLNRWCHRAMGDRAMAEQELRALIATHRRQASED